jgi:hypothetical protein
VSIQAAISPPIGDSRSSGLHALIALHDVLGGDEHLFKATINLAQFPEDQKKNNHDYEQQESDVHLLISSKGLGILGRSLK